MEIRCLNSNLFMSCLRMVGGWLHVRLSGVEGHGTWGGRKEAVEDCWQDSMLFAHMSSV